MRALLSNVPKGQKCPTSSYAIISNSHPLALTPKCVPYHLCTSCSGTAVAGAAAGVDAAVAFALGGTLGVTYQVCGTTGYVDRWAYR